MKFLAPAEQHCIRTPLIKLCVQLHCDLPRLCVLWGSIHDTISYLDVWVVSGIEFLWEYPAIFLKTVCLHMTSFWWPPLRRWHCCGHNKLLRNYHDRFLGGRQKVCLDPRSQTAEQHLDLWGCQACKIKTNYMILGFAWIFFNLVVT